jgi:hypothetical protein
MALGFAGEMSSDSEKGALALLLENHSPGAMRVLCSMHLDNNSWVLKISRWNIASSQAIPRAGSPAIVQAPEKACGDWKEFPGRLHHHRSPGCTGKFSQHSGQLQQDFISGVYSVYSGSEKCFHNLHQQGIAEVMDLLMP